MNPLTGFFIVFLAILALAWAGLRVRPAPFASFPEQHATLDTVPLPRGLPAPVERFYRQMYGERIPVITSAIISGRARLRLFGLTFPGRFRFTHRAGRDYRHYLEATLFGFPLMKVNEYYLDGHSRLELPFGVTEGEPQVDRAANLGLWAESFWFPAALVTDPRLEWTAIDDHTAALHVPFGEGRQTLVARFDPETGRVRFLEAMRYQDAGDRARSLWINQVKTWGQVDGQPTMTEATVTWFDEGRPWAVFSTEQLVLNAELGEYLQAKGP